MKNIPVGAEMRFQIRVEMFNIFNQVNYGNPNASFGAAAFGSITSAGSMRQIQLGGQVVVLVDAVHGNVAITMRSEDSTMITKIHGHIPR